MWAEERFRKKGEKFIHSKGPSPYKKTKVNNMWFKIQGGSEYEINDGDQPQEHSNTQAHLSTVNVVTTPYPRNLKLCVGLKLHNVSMTRHAFNVSVPKVAYSHTSYFSTSTFVQRRLTQKTQYKSKVWPDNLNSCFNN